MNFALPPEWERFVRDQVGLGHFASESEVVCEALRLLDTEEKRDEAKLNALRRLVGEAVDQVERGEVLPLDMEEIRAEGRRRMAGS